ncbi:hypothetical protein BSAF29S_02616 [Bacillus safensis subsp. safensis]
MAHAAKGGGLVSGDSYSMMELGAGKYAAAISDGMGNGARAHLKAMKRLSCSKNIGVQVSMKKWRLKPLIVFYL